jgi:site-specific DNA recombinase
VTGERIRDKIAASKRKGLWMGGVVPLGYDLREHRLIINPAEAELVRQIYRRYLKLGSVRLVKAELDRYQEDSTRRSPGKGIPPHGYPFSRGALYLLLSNPLYVGEIRHRGVRYPGQQPPIIERELWESVQRQLREHAVLRHHCIPKVETSALAGKLFDSSGERLTPSHTLKGDLRYRYYVSARLTNAPAQQVANGWRLPAPELERTVAAVAQQLLADEPAIASAVEEVGLAASNLPLALQTAREWRGKLQSKDGTAAALAALVDRVELRRDGLRLTLKLRLPTAESEDGQSRADALITRFFPLQVRRRGVELRLVLSDARAPAPSVDLVLLKTLARGRRWFEELAAGRAASIPEIARREGVSVRYVGRLIRLAFLAPEIVEAIAAGRQPAGLTAELLTRRTRLCADWEGQQRELGFAAKPPP